MEAGFEHTPVPGERLRRAFAWSHGFGAGDERRVFLRQVRFSHPEDYLMRISIDITGPDEQALTEAARRLNVPADELAAAALRDLLTRRDEEFERAAERVLERNRELYRRLA